jgi:multiple sugar transport system substrate-binding protein
MRRSKRWWKSVAAMLAALTVVSVSIGSTGVVASASSPVTLQMWARADDAGFLPKLVKSFNSTHPTLQIQLTLVPDAQVVQKYSLAASTGSGPDIVSTEIGTMATFTPTNWYQNITSLVNTLPYRKYLSPAHLGQATYNGEIKGIPFTADVSALYWNKTLFSKAGLNPNDPPTDWAQIAADAAKVRGLGGNTYGYFFSGACAGCMAFTMLPYVWAQGGNILKENSAVGTPTLYPNAALDSTLTFFRQLWQSGSVAPTAKTENGTNQFGLFFDGTIGMFVQGTYPFSILKTQYPGVKFGVELVPSMNGTSHASYVGGDNISITQNAKPGAKTALLWFATQGERELASLGVMPAREDIAQATYATEDARQAVFVKALSVGHTPRSTKASPVLFDNTGPYGQMIQSAIFGSGSIAAAMQSGQNSAVQLLGQ